MVFARASMDDYVRRLGVSKAAAIPCVARSLTGDEARKVRRRHIGWSVTVLAFFAALYGGIMLSARPAADKWAWFSGFLGLMLVLVALLTWLKLRKWRDYRDPQIRVEIGADEVAVIGPAGRDARPYEALAPIRLLSGATKSSRYFIGIVLDTRLGPIRLEDDWYGGGLAAAGAILKRLEERGLPLIQPG